MKYRVHRFNLKMSEDQNKLEHFLSSLDGEIIAVIPNVKPTFKPMGATASVDFLLIVEKVG